MADYQRLISYMYRYERGIKKNNVGYLRLETRNNQIRATIHLQIPPAAECILPTYFISWNHGKMSLIFLGDTIVKGQTVDAKLVTETGNIHNSGYSMNDMGGLIILADEKIFYGTEWSDHDIEWSQVMEALRSHHAESVSDKEREARDNDSEIKAANTEAREEAEVAKIASVDITSVNVKAEEVEITNVSSAEVHKEAEVEVTSVASTDVQEEAEAGIINETSTEMQEEAEVEITDVSNIRTQEESDEGITNVVSTEVQTEEVKEEVDEVRIQNQNSKIATFYPKENVLEEAYEQDGFIHPNLFAGCEEDRGPKEIFKYQESEIKDKSVIARELFRNCPRMYPFEDNEIVACVKLDIQDINQFPLDIRNKVSNSFLLHGYYSYHHIIFIKLQEHNEAHYFLGVPGIFQNREKNMARTFGFEYFKGIKKRDLQPGEFGYWFIRVDI